MNQNNKIKIFIGIVVCVISVLSLYLYQTINVVDGIFCKVISQVECQKTNMYPSIYFSDCSTFIKSGDFERYVGHKPFTDELQFYKNITVKWCK